MAAKSPNVRDRIPSVADLLESPAIRTLTERLNRNAVVTGVRSFLDELRSDLTRRGAEAVWPTLRELAERAARHIAASQQTSNRTAINATGRIWGGPWVGRPQADAALERTFATGRDFVAAPTPLASALSPGDVESQLARITGAAAGVAVHSYAGALWLAAAAAAAGRELIVSRGELGDVEPGCPLSKLITSSGATLREVGSTNRTTAHDYEAAINPQTSAVLSVTTESFQIHGDTANAELEELVALARDRELTLIDAIGFAPLVELPAEVNWPDRSAKASIAAGANLVVLRGDGLVGGPPCGIIAGDRELVQRITTHPLFAAHKLDAPRTAALGATLESYVAGGTGGEASLPLMELLSTPLENLHNRAERLAPQLRQADGIRTADVVSMQSHCDGLAGGARLIRSFGIALTPTNGDVVSLERKLASAAEPVFGRIEGDRLMLDLRTVLPRQDQAIVRALVSQRQSISQTAADSDVTIS